jgi:DNA-binding PadR family transcriptional regulator
MKPEAPRLSHKTLLLLGLLREGPMTGYDLNRIVLAHGHLYADLKKGNIYHLLEALQRNGYVSVKTQAGARGPRGERLIYKLTSAGEQGFVRLVREVLSSFEPSDVGLASAIVYLPVLGQEEALALLEQRRELVATRLRDVSDEISPVSNELLRLAGQHLVTIIESELKWVDAALEVVRRATWVKRPAKPPAHRTKARPRPRGA